MLHTKQHYKNIMVECGGRTEESRSLRKDAALYSGGVAGDTPPSPARRQQDEQAVAGWVLLFSILWPLCSFLHQGGDV